MVSSVALRQGRRLNDISNADAFFFVLVFWVGGHDATELPLQRN